MSPCSVTVNMQKEPVEYPTFMEAWRAFAKRIHEMIAKEELTIQSLETACWIQEGNYPPVYFYEARDWAIEHGWSAEELR